MIKKSFTAKEHAFTLAEVIVSSALVVGIMGLLLTTVDQTHKTINNTTTKIAQFQAARTAFDAMTRTLSQATLNTYWDLDYDLNQNPTTYRRQSDLHFISGKASNFFIDKKSQYNPLDYPTHGVFFQAPLGITYQESGAEENANNRDLRVYRSLNNLLSVVGYFIKWGPDSNAPDFVTKLNDSKLTRYRYRLMQVLQPSETVEIYYNQNYTVTKPSYPGNPNYDSLDWLKVALGQKSPSIKLDKIDKNDKKVFSKEGYANPFAENIVALIIVPKVAQADRKKPDLINDLTEDYEYNSRPQIAYNAQGRYPAVKSVSAVLGSTGSQSTRQVHQLPPILQVTMVAIDEESAIRLEDYSIKAQDFSDGLFQKLGVTTETFEKDLGDISNTTKESLLYRLSNPDHNLPSSDLPRPKLKYRVFTTDVVLRGSKWTKIQ